MKQHCCVCCFLLYLATVGGVRSTVHRSFEKVYRPVSHNGCKVNAHPCGLHSVSVMTNLSIHFLKKRKASQEGLKLEVLPSVAQSYQQSAFFCLLLPSYCRSPKYERTWSIYGQTHSQLLMNINLIFVCRCSVKCASMRLVMVNGK